MKKRAYHTPYVTKNFTKGNYKKIKFTNQIFDTRIIEKIQKTEKYVKKLNIKNAKKKRKAKKKKIKKIKIKKNNAKNSSAT